MNPKISIVTPSYNQGSFLEETIDSVLSQGYDNLEYIIIDGGSDDDSVEIIKKYEKYLKYWISESDYGQSHAIIKGLAYCTGEIFNWLNSDDKLVEDSLNLIAGYFSRNNNIKVLSGYEIHFGGGQREELKSGTRLQVDIESSVVFAAFYQPSTFWRLSTFKEIGLNSNLHYLMDTDMWVRFLLRYGTDGYMKIKNPIARFRLHHQSKSLSSSHDFFKERWQLRSRLLHDNVKNMDISGIIDTLAPSPRLEGYNYKSQLFDKNQLKCLVLQQLLIDLNSERKINESLRVFYKGLLSGFWNISFLRAGLKSHILAFSK